MKQFWICAFPERVLWTQYSARQALRAIVLMNAALMMWFWKSVILCLLFWSAVNLSILQWQAQEYIYIILLMERHNLWIKITKNHAFCWVLLESLKKMKVFCEGRNLNELYFGRIFMLVQPWVNYLTVLYLSFMISKIG